LVTVRPRLALLDVGGTLWPDRAPERVNLHDGRTMDSGSFTRMALGAALPGCSDRQVRGIAIALRRAAKELQAGEEIDTHGAIREITALLALGELPPHIINGIQRAMIVPFVGTMPFFPGTPELFRTVRHLGLTCVLISNTVWRDAAAYREELANCEFAHDIRGIVTSQDVGFSKPHRRMFETALSIGAASANEAVMIGNSERNDITPARAMGMRTIRVCIEEPRALDSAADFVVTSLSEVCEHLVSLTHSAEADA
jgi:FMN phosphatase YigB (HAD superfamily)